MNRPGPSSPSRRLTHLRWWLLGCLLIAILAAERMLAIPLPLPPMLAVWLLLLGFNALAARRAGRDEMPVAELAGQLAVDLAGMGVLLYLAGGATNPLVSLLLLPVAFAALSLPARWAAGIATLAIALYSFLMLYSLPLPIADAERATRLHLAGMWLTFVVSTIMATWFITRMTASIRARDAELAAVREDALRDAQVVALGQLAAGAAHELGTPLATMNVLAGELAQDARLPNDAREDMALLVRQIARCKDIVGGLTRKAGIARAGEMQPATDWLDGLLVRWRSLWPRATCTFSIDGSGEAPRIRVEPAIEQAIVNLLNNAAKLTDGVMALCLDWDAQRLRIAVTDTGPGFPPEILRCCGAEPVSPQGDGAGIGLWLTRAAVERAGGRLGLENTATGGRAVIELPLRS